MAQVRASPDFHWNVYCFGERGGYLGRNRVKVGKLSKSHVLGVKCRLNVKSLSWARVGKRNDKL